MDAKKMAVIQVKNTQYLVKEGDEVALDRYAAIVGSKLKFEEVLLKVDGDKIEVGTPNVPKAFVEAEVLAHTQGKKIRVFTYKSKSRERKIKGARAKYTMIKISKIN